MFNYDFPPQQTKLFEDFCEVEDDLCTAEFTPFESLYGNCINIHIKGLVESIPTEVSKEICCHVPPNGTGKMHKVWTHRTKNHIMWGVIMPTVLWSWEIFVFYSTQCFCIFFPDWTMLITILLCFMFGILITIILGAIIFKKLTQPDSQSTIFSKLLVSF